MASYKSPEDEIKELKVQLRRMTELLEYYRANCPFDIEESMPPIGYFVTPMDNWTAAFITNGRPVLIESNLQNDVNAIARCWVHLKTTDPYVIGRHNALKQTRKNAT
ncbi:hypothetical protein [Vreelandella venusta]|uniref:hypothetical protein n=1 Tax=Vreelandella venusta TaxID=44935 RepID=UPI00116BC29C|nr:hypothetical protein [Halomonas venusta]GEK52332.1 hypothetical protein HVE01_30530 [Halomonas venusta]